MNLLVDAGNTHTKIRSWHNNKLGALQQVDGAGEALQAYSQRQAFVSCVATPQRKTALQQQFTQWNIQAHWLTSPAVGLGIQNAYAQSGNWGVDRWLALAAAYRQAQQACCVIDLGTAITVDLCDAQGQHLGGLIAPGLRALQQALQHNTSLPVINPQNAPSSSAWLAKDTQEALQAGAFQSACGLLERTIRLAQTQHACEKVYLTGGHAGTIQAHLGAETTLDEDLVFQGLALFAQEFSTKANDPL